MSFRIVVPAKKEQNSIVEMICCWCGKTTIGALGDITFNDLVLGHGKLYHVCSKECEESSRPMRWAVDNIREVLNAPMVT